MTSDVSEDVTADVTPPALEVLAAGVATSVRDGGRVGQAHLGRGRGGAVDHAALQLANRLLGNPSDAPAFETSGGLVLLAHAPVLVAVTGSPADLRVSDGPAVGWGMPVALPTGARLHVGRLLGGARTYVAVRGGVDRIDESGRIRVGPDPGQAPSTHPAAPRPLDRHVRVWPGPRLDWFADDAWTALLSTEWEVGPASDRIGLRLVGPPLARVRTDELPSEGLVEGAIQVPPDGQPIVMLADHPTTGGYPVIGVVDPADIGLVAQRPPGEIVRFARTHR